MKLLADENFDNTIVRGLLRHKPDIDIVRVQDVGLSGEADPIILQPKRIEYCLPTMWQQLRFMPMNG